MSDLEPTDAVLSVPDDESGRAATDPQAGEEPEVAQEVMPQTGLADPVIRNLVLAFLGVIALFLLAIASALLLGFMKPATAPRTLAERNLQVYGSQVQAGGADTATWAKYIGALIDAGQTSEARSMVNKALETVKTKRSEILVEQARLEYVLKNYQASVDAAEAARLDAEAQQAARLEELKAKGIKETATNALPTSWLPAVHQKADALAALGEDAKAIEAYTLYLKESPTDSTILYTRGQLELKAGDKAAAEKDFREALRFIPDYQAALDALEGMGVTTK